MLRVFVSGFVVAGAMLFTNAASADDIGTGGAAESGFSFFMGLGQSTVRYQETASTLPVKSDVQVNNIILNSGALYALDYDYLFSIENLSTFYPGKATESWNATSAFTSGGYSFQSGLLQQNSFSLSQSTTRLYLHRRLADNWFVMGGPSFGSNSFKRYGFVAAQPGVNTGSVVEESSSEILVNLGLELESERVLNRPSHYSLSLSVGAPVWRRLQNTNYPNDTFDATQGYDVMLAGRYSWAIMRYAQIGLWGQLSTSHRGSQTIGNAELPSSKLDAASYGVELLWKI